MTVSQTVLPAVADAAPEETPVPRYVKTNLPSSPEGFPGMALYIIASADDITEIDKIEGNVYYLLAAEPIKTSSTVGKSTTTTTTIQPGLYKRIRIMSGHGLVAVTDGEALGFGQVEERAYFGLPSMPMTLVDKIDQFFRQVDRENHTEAIVILGYDKNYLESENPGDGWVVMVPEQKNTSGNCKYEPASIMEDKPDSVMIVGTWHSHPGMRAFASPTDIADQKNNDGLHITTGWSGTNGPSEYHIEYQLGNRRFSYAPEDIFDFAPKEIHDVSDWTKKVSKQYPTQTTTYKSGTNKTGTGTTAPGSSSTSAVLGSRLHGEFFRQRHNDKRPKGTFTCPDLLQNTVVAVVAADAEACPVCKKKFDNFSDRNRRCTDCFTYLLLAEDEGDLMKILEARKTTYQGKAYMPGLEFLDDPKAKAKYPVLVWDGTGEKNDITYIYSPTSGISDKGKKALGMTATA